MSKIIRDPVHNIIELDDKALRIIDTSVFQRMRGISQLGVTYLVYPSARHSRFEHSLGAYHVAGKMIESIEKGGEHKFEEEEKILLKTAALLHDIGHGPYSHTFEHIFPTYKHEKMAKEIISNENSGINAELQKAINEKNYPPKCIDHICKLINGESDFDNFGNVSALIHSQLDCDRLDYLLRDSYFCGITAFIDVDYIFKSMIIHPIHELDNNMKIVYRENARNAIEQYLLLSTANNKMAQFSADADTGTLIPTAAGENVFGCTDSSAPRLLTISTSTISAGSISKPVFITVKDEDGNAGTNNITINTEGAQTMDGLSQITITSDYGNVRLYSNGSNLFVVAP